MREPKQYDLGDSVRVTASFTDPDTGDAVDPDTVGFKYKDPAGTVTTLTYGDGARIVKDSAGHYHVDVDANLAGRWYYRFYSTGAGQAATERSFTVRPSQFS